MRLIVLSRQHDDLDAGFNVQHLLEQLESFGHRIGVGWQAEVHRDHGRLVAAHLQERALAVAGSHRFETIQRPLDLLLQRQIVLDDQQRRVDGAQGASRRSRSEPWRASNRGSMTVIVVPWPGWLTTEIWPPSSRMYWKLS